MGDSASVAGFESRPTPRLASHAVNEHTAAKITKKTDHNSTCPREVIRGSIRKGKPRSASKEAKFETANKWYGSDPPPARACQVCTSGLVAPSRINGKPIEAASTTRI